MFGKMARLVLGRFLELQSRIMAMREAKHALYKCSTYITPTSDPGIANLQAAIQKLIWHCDMVYDSVTEEIGMEHGQSSDEVPVITAWMVEIRGEEEDSSPEFAGPFDSEEQAKEWVEGNIWNCDDRVWNTHPISTDPEEISRS